MTETKSLVANLVFTVDDSSTKALTEQLEKAMDGVSIGVNNKTGSQSSSSANTNPNEDPVRKTAKATEETVDAISEMKEETKESDSFLNKAMTGLTEGLAVGIGLFQGSFDIIKGAWNFIRGKVPFLNDLFSMLTDVIDLVWLPFGIALAEVMVPFMEIIMEQVMGLVNELMKIYQEEGIVGLLTKGIGMAVGFLFDTAIRVLNAIPESCFIGQIAHGIANVLEWIKEHLPIIENVLKATMNFITLIMNNIKLIISAITGYIAYKMAKDSMGILGQIPGASLIAGGIGAVAGFLGMSALGFADGGFVEPKDGGHWVNVGEGGEREYIVPQSKVQSFAQSVGGSSSITNNYYISGYTDSELRNIILETINESAIRSKLRGDL